HLFEKPSLTTGFFAFGEKKHYHYRHQYSFVELFSAFADFLLSLSILYSRIPVSTLLHFISFPSLMTA
ncbi:hypothetical protein, partial [Vibrio mimicus]|uniref:hypothetical protein n=1 Tax=Vibrio mimicus TaxID=674 RepID=UPI001CA34DBE